MSDRGTEVLNIVARHLVRERAQRRQLKACDHGIEGKWVYLDVIVDLFPTKERRKIVVGPGQHGIPAKLPGVSSPLETESFGQVQTVLSGLTRQDRGSSKTVNDAGNFCSHRRRVAAGFLQVVRKLGT